MTRVTTPDLLLTDAVRRAGVSVVVETVGGISSSNARRTPYVERYGQVSGVYETPVENLQRAADDEAARQAHRA